MGTPGDKAKIGKVVGSEIQSTPESEQETLPSSQSELLRDPILPSTSTGMGRHLSRLQEIQSLSSVNIIPPPIISKPETFQSSIEQPTIEDYFTQSKYYPSVSENIQTVPPILPPKTFLNIDQPGPSGLQTPKTKPTTSLSKNKKTKSQSHQTQKKSYTCPNCQKNFASQEKLTKHQQIHTGSSPFKCEHCKKTFTSKFKLVRHALIHSDRKPFSCTVCERTFHRKDHLKNHIKVHSPSKKIYFCEKPNCKKEYTSILSYRKHQAIHAAEEGNLMCQICSVSFDTKEDILYHLKIHAGSRTVKSPNEKKFVCDQCDRRFFTKKDVRRHLVVHTGLREFLCQFCPQRFGRKDHLVRHIKKSHHKKYQSEDVQTAIKTETSESTSSQPDVQQIKREVDIKTDFFETSLTTPETTTFDTDLGFSLEGEIFGDDELQTFLGPSTSQHGELKDLGSTILEEIGESSTSSTLVMEENLPSQLEEVLNKDVVLSDPAIQKLMQPSEEKNLKLPAFSKTFQPPPPP